MGTNRFIIVCVELAMAAEQSQKVFDADVLNTNVQALFQKRTGSPTHAEDSIYHPSRS